ncbi:hypothetical protein COCSUDRAFT_83617 [Coccomyxa subellipsoidea C-169]|uniref:Uncharacterized protein n=1 Tax=Coccomyxa subellipsoidea (strain C-169) TaxID=574566 RepID=I0Z6H3_COCSC|nr:hypothetical protein COCSUDRAFT_83617 [Coccomyxa subellipsoidea C-169]EIE26242.1 hypothetical protein COCSUDRAFT_83617 [Coccomyxa subellipsoidea C-169]|eukprot:XP_005650786.1 hypothetical protein COCSUDRAFT_83617 [Coccomyxa subellipsoidea C-169]
MSHAESGQCSCVSEEQGKPKDFDILTTATPVQIKRLFGSCRIIGKRFPIVHVYADGACLEVSSFGTRANRELIPQDAAAFLPRHKPHDKGKAGRKPGAGMPAAAGARPEVLWASARVDNAMARDFTCNAIMFDPFSALLLDYAGGFRDCQRRVLRTVIDPETSFSDDPARMLRAVRHAARVGLTIEEKTGQAMVGKAGEVLKLPGSRLLMEAQALFSYGAAAASLRLLWRYRLLDLLVPPLAERFTRRRLPRNPRRPVSEPVLDLLEQLDAKMQPHLPIDWTVWAAVMVAPLVTDALGAAQRAKRAKAGSKQRSGKQGPDRVEASKAEEEDGGCSICKRSADVLEKEAKFRGIVDDTVRSLILASSGGAEVKGMIPVGQWQKVGSLLVGLMDSVELPSLRDNACEDCQADLARKASFGSFGSKDPARQLLINVLGGQALQWLDIRAAL